MEQHLLAAISALRATQEEILHPCELYSQLEDMQSTLETAIQDKTWEGKV